MELFSVVLLELFSEAIMYVSSKHINIQVPVLHHFQVKSD
jgi:hypothetical protein